MKKKEKHPGGRPSKWTKEIRDAIILNLENGATHKRAAILAGVGESTFGMWKNKAIKDNEEGKETEYTKFLDQVIEAQEKYIAWLQQSVNRDAERDGKLALEVLSRKRPEEFGKQDSLRIKGNFNITNFDVDLTPEEEEDYKNRLKDMYGEDLE